MVIDGSFVTIKVKPNDLDLILVLRRRLDPEHELIPAEYNVQSMRMVRKKYGFDVRAAAPDGPDYADYLEFFSRVRPDDSEVRTNRTTKGLLRIDL